METMSLQEPSYPILAKELHSELIDSLARFWESESSGVTGEPHDVSLEKQFLSQENAEVAHYEWSSVAQ